MSKAFKDDITGEYMDDYFNSSTSHLEFTFKDTIVRADLKLEFSIPGKTAEKTHLSIKTWNKLRKEFAFCLACDAEDII